MNTFARRKTDAKETSTRTAMILVSAALIVISVLALFVAVMVMNVRTSINGQAVQEELGPYNTAYKVECEGVTWHLVLSDKALADSSILTESHMKNKKLILRGYKGWRGAGERYFFVSDINP